MKLIIGLGNIGNAYEDTYHNVGFLVADKIAKTLGVAFKNRECESDIAQINIKGEMVLIAKPRTYMNESGRALSAFLKKYPKLNPQEDVVVVFDDIDLASGAVRIKETGGAGTHNGMKSILAAMGSRNFRRVRVGIGEKPNEMSMVDFVLAKIKSKSPIREAVNLASNAICEFLTGEKTYMQLMNEINSQF